MIEINVVTKFDFVILIVKIQILNSSFTKKGLIGLDMSF